MLLLFSRYLYCDIQFLIKLACFFFFISDLIEYSLQIFWKYFPQSKNYLPEKKKKKKVKYSSNNAITSSKIFMQMKILEVNLGVEVGRKVF